MSKVHDQAGKGLQQCSQCQKYFGAAISACPNCETEVSDKDSLASIYKEGGLGKKLCSHCKKYYASALKYCPACGSKHRKQKKKKMEMPPKDISEYLTYDEGGRGRKQCQNCKRFYFSKLLICPNCRVEYVKIKKEKAVKKPKDIGEYPIYDEGGQGKKQCQNCKKFYGIMLPACPNCRTKYVKIEKNPEIKPPKIYPVFNEYAKGRRQCQNCEKFYTFRISKCPKCQTVYEKPPTPIKTYDVPSRRRKRCPDCELFVGDKEPVCICGHKFDVRKVITAAIAKNDYVPSKEDMEDSRDAKICDCGFLPVIAPSGESPAKLNDSDYESVMLWKSKVIVAGHEKGLHYTPSALRYFIAHYHFNRYSSEYKEACEALKN